MIIYFVVVVLGLVGIVKLDSLLGEKKGRNRDGSYSPGKMIRAILTLLGIGIVFSPLVYEFPGWPFSRVITFEKGGWIAERPLGALTIGKEFSNVPGTRQISTGVSFLTENPKIRKIRYCVDVKITDLNLFFKERTKRHSFGISDFFKSGEMIRSTAELKTGDVFSVENRD